MPVRRAMLLELRIARRQGLDMEWAGQLQGEWAGTCASRAPQISTGRTVSSLRFSRLASSASASLTCTLAPRRRHSAACTPVHSGRDTLSPRTYQAQELDEGSIALRSRAAAPGSGSCSRRPSQQCHHRGGHQVPQASRLRRHVPGELRCASARTCNAVAAVQ